VVIYPLGVSSLRFKMMDRAVKKDHEKTLETACVPWEELDLQGRVNSPPVKRILSRE
jgi:hypothetical protein